MLESKQPNYRGVLRKNAAGGCSELSPSRRTKKPLTALIAFAAAVALICGAAAPAYANPLADATNAVVSLFAGDQNTDEGVSTQALEDHTVSGVSPRGTTINLFDYWVTGRYDNDVVSWNNNQVNSGINSGHVLKFGKGISADLGLVNQWTNSAAPRTGIVQNKLGSDGYPVLSASVGTGSLAYLFNNEAVDGKAVYTDV